MACFPILPTTSHPQLSFLSASPHGYYHSLFYMSSCHGHSLQVSIYPCNMFSRPQPVRGSSAFFLPHKHFTGQKIMFLYYNYALIYILERKLNYECAWGAETRCWAGVEVAIFLSSTSHGGGSTKTRSFLPAASDEAYSGVWMRLVTSLSLTACSDQNRRSAFGTAINRQAADYLSSMRWLTVVILIFNTATLVWLID